MIIISPRPNEGAVATLFRAERWAFLGRAPLRGEGQSPASANLQECLSMIIIPPRSNLDRAREIIISTRPNEGACSDAL